MAYRDLREFIRTLEKEGELRRVRAEVDPVLEITEVVQRVARGWLVPEMAGKDFLALSERPGKIRFFDRRILSMVGVSQGSLWMEPPVL